MKQYSLPIKTDREHLTFEVSRPSADDVVTLTLWHTPMTGTEEKTFIRSDTMSLREYRKLVREMRAAADFLEYGHEKA